MITLRTASEADAAALAVFAERTFRTTFGAANTAANMDLFCRGHFGEPLQRAELNDPAMSTTLAEEQGAIVGYSQLKLRSAAPCVTAARPAEIARIYVDASWHGRGVAQRLMAESIGVARTAGADAVWLGVWERNPQAISFYRKVGFIEVGSQVFLLGDDPQRDLIMTTGV